MFDKDPTTERKRAGMDGLAAAKDKEVGVTLPQKRKAMYWVDLNRFDKKPNKSTWIEMSTALSLCGYNVTVLTGCSDQGAAERYRKDRIRCLPALDVGLLFRFSLMAGILRWLWRNAGRGDVVMLTPASLYLAPLLLWKGFKNIHLDVRTVPVEVHGFKGHLGRIMFWLVPLTLFRRAVHGCSFITERLKKDVEREFGAVFPNAAIWSSGVNTELFFKEPDKRTSLTESRKYILFYHGTLTANRGVDRVILALCRLHGDLGRHIQFVVVGAGAAMDSLKSLVRENGLDDVVVFKGLVAYETVPEEIEKADCCICPLPDRPEWNVSSPLKVFEYLASGKPVILTPITAHTDVLCSEEFVVWTKGFGIDDYAMAIEEAFQRRKELSAAAARGSEVARDRFDWKSIGQRFAQYLDKVYCAS